MWVSDLWQRIRQTAYCPCRPVVDESPRYGSPLRENAVKLTFLQGRLCYLQSWKTRSSLSAEKGRQIEDSIAHASAVRIQRESNGEMVVGLSQCKPCNTNSLRVQCHASAASAGSISPRRPYAGGHRFGRDRCFPGEAAEVYRCAKPASGEAHRLHLARCSFLRR